MAKPIKKPKLGIVIIPTPFNRSFNTRCMIIAIKASIGDRTKALIFTIAVCIVIGTGPRGNWNKPAIYVITANIDILTILFIFIILIPSFLFLPDQKLVI